MPNDKFYRMVGLAMRAGRLALGEGAVSDSIRSGKAKLVIISDDASENTEKKFRNSSDYYKVPLITADDRERLGISVGRSFAVIVAVCDDGFAGSIMKAMES